MTHPDDTRAVLDAVADCPDRGPVLDARADCNCPPVVLCLDTRRPVTFEACVRCRCAALGFA